MIAQTMEDVMSGIETAPSVRRDATRIRVARLLRLPPLGSLRYRLSSTRTGTDRYTCRKPADDGRESLAYRTRKERRTPMSEDNEWKIDGMRQTWATEQTRAMTAPLLAGSGLEPPDPSTWAHDGYFTLWQGEGDQLYIGRTDSSDLRSVTADEWSCDECHADFRQPDASGAASVARTSSAKGRPSDAMDALGWVEAEIGHSSASCGPTCQV